MLQYVGCLALAMAMLLPQKGLAQQKETPPAESPTFRTGVNLIVVPLVVRDKKGNTVGGLEKSDFELFDQRKSQVISTFSAESRLAPTVKATLPSGSAPLPTPPASPSYTPARVDQESIRFTAYLFDDLHLKFEDIARAQKAALRNLENMAPEDQIGVFTTSGQTGLDFTTDRQKVKATLEKLRPRTTTAPQCPDIDYYLGEKIFNRSDPRAMTVGLIKLASCMPDTPAHIAIALVENAAREAYFFGKQMARVSLSVVRNLSRRMAVLPEQKSIVFISPGFISPRLNFEKSALIDLATRSGVLINTMDARGIYVDPMLDASKGFSGASNPSQFTLEGDFHRAAVLEQGHLLAELAEGTGGMRYYNDNDLLDGLKRLSALPEHSYILGFEPQDLKPNGKFHTLKVRLKNRKGLTLYARKGYYALTPEQQKTYTGELGTMLISGAKRQELPIRVTPQLVPLPDGKHSLEMVANLKASDIPYSKADGINSNTIMVTFSLFDETGSIREFITRKIDLKLKDDVLKDLPAGEIQFITPLGIHSGKFQAQMVAQDSMGQKTTIENLALQLP